MQLGARQKQYTDTHRAKSEADVNPFKAHSLKGILNGGNDIPQQYYETHEERDTIKPGTVMILGENS